MTVPPLRGAVLFEFASLLLATRGVALVLAVLLLVVGAVGLTARTRAHDREAPLTHLSVVLRALASTRARALQLADQVVVLRELARALGGGLGGLLALRGGEEIGKGALEGCVCGKWWK